MMIDASAGTGQMLTPPVQEVEGLKSSPAAMLVVIGEALYGRRWQKPLADALGLHVRQVQRWLNYGDGGGWLSAEHKLYDDALVLLRRRLREIADAEQMTVSWLRRERGRG